MPEARPLNLPLACGECTPAEWPTLLGTLDEAFVHSRGRVGSLATRFPAAVGEDFLSRLIVARQNGQPVACCVVREFDWCSSSSRWRGAMVGMVHTTPAARGRGFAAHVLDEALRGLKARDVDFAVLWSGLERFYENLGWVRHDRGVFGSIDLAEVAAEIAPVDGYSLEALRRAGETWFLPRNDLAWQASPLPSLRTVCLQPAGRGDAYVLVGQSDTTHYLHEVGGATDAFPELWRLACANATRVFVNQALGSPFHRWLAQHTTMRFTGQSLAHWWLLSERARRAPWRGWYLPWFDRM